MTKRISVLLLAVVALSACSTGASRQGSANWDSISGTSVAKVNNIKSLISPGVY